MGAAPGSVVNTPGRLGSAEPGARTKKKQGVVNEFANQAPCFFAAPRACRSASGPRYAHGPWHARPRRAELFPAFNQVAGPTLKNTERSEDHIIPSVIPEVLAEPTVVGAAGRSALGLYVKPVELPTRRVHFRECLRGYLRATKAPNSCGVCSGIPVWTPPTLDKGCTSRLPEPGDHRPRNAQWPTVSRPLMLSTVRLR